MVPVPVVVVALWRGNGGKHDQYGKGNFFWEGYVADGGGRRAWGMCTAAAPTIECCK